jgi:hypothetical protein
MKINRTPKPQPELKEFKDATHEEMVEFMQFLLTMCDDFGKIAYLWLTCRKREIATKLQITFESDFQSWWKNYQIHLLRNEVKT